MQESSRRDRKIRAIILTGIASVLWGTSFPAIKIGLKYVDAYMFVFLRFSIASIIMLFLLLIRRNYGFEFARRRVVWFLGIANGVAYLFQYVGMNSTSASKSSLLVNLSAIWVAILSWVILKERLGNRRGLGILFGIVGVFLIATNLDFQMLGQGAIVGDLLVLFSGVVWAFFTVYNKRLVSGVRDVIQPTTWVIFVTLLPLIPSLLFSTSSPSQLPIDAWLAIAYTAIFCWVIPYYLWSEGLKYISAVNSTIILLAEVLVALAISSIFLNETLTLISGIGAFLIIAAIVFVS
ncbi:MAG: DMT family transporter [Candidatus Bathyarchaeia archaeon]